MKRLLTLRGALGLTAGLLICVLGLSLAQAVQGASWNRIEPLKSRRAEVVEILGRPVSEAADGALRFNVMGGSVQISFVDAKFVVAKKLKPELEGTVLQIILQHERSSDTPESMKLVKNSAFVRDDKENISIFRNPKDGIVYTFIDGKLKTTRYTFADGQLVRARR